MFLWKTAQQLILTTCNILVCSLTVNGMIWVHPPNELLGTNVTWFPGNQHSALSTDNSYPTLTLLRKDWDAQDWNHSLLKQNCSLPKRVDTVESMEKENTKLHGFFFPQQNKAI